MATSFVQEPQSTADSIVKVARALIVVPSASRRSVTWYARARFVLSWQIRWLLRNDMAVTLVEDDAGALLGPSEVRAAWRDSGINVISWSQLEDLFESGALASHLDTDAALLMLGPALLDCDPREIVASCKATERTVAVVRQRNGARLQVAYCCSLNDMAAWWPDLRTALRIYVSQPHARLPVPPCVRKVRVRGALLRSGDDSEMGRITAWWPICAPRAGLAQIPGYSGAFRVVGEPPVISPTARLRGPVFIEEGVVVKDHASIGPWALLECGCSIGQSVRVEAAVIGAGASIEPKGCVYASIVAPHARISANLPILKAQFSARDTVPQLLPNVVEVYHGPSLWYLVAKRLLDLIIGVVALAVLSPLLCLAMLVCLVTQGWPIFFLQERVGIHGKRFRVLKLRTMRRDAHLPVHLQQLEASDRFKIPDDPRVTPIGRLLRKSSIDELPQLLNVIAGQMSIVGPRPIVPKETVRFGVYSHDLLRVKPGMTGLWQVRGRSNTTYARRIMLDVEYGDQWSLWLDLAILVRTVPAVLFQRGSM